MLTFGSLFSGIGGFDLGFEQAGMKCAWQCEIDKQARSVLSTHWPNITIIEDVRNVRTGAVEYVDLICGGFPCQDVSVAGKREGLAGKRSGLWFEFLRVLDELRPQWVVIENVPGLLSSNKGRDFATILQGLVKLRYGVSWRVLDAQYFGVAQRRRRVFIVGSLGDGRSAQVLFEREGLFGHPPAHREARKTTPTLTKEGTGVSRPGFNEDGWYVTGTLYKGTPGKDAGITGIVGTITERSGSKHGTDEIASRYLIPTAFDWQSGGDVRLNISDKPMLQANQTPAVLYTEEPILGDGRPGRATLRQGRTTELYSSYYGVRRLTPTECERLQGFPDGWTAYFTEHGQCVIMGAWLNHFVRLPDVIDRSLTEKTASVLCTTSGSKNTEVRIYRAEMTPPLPDAKSVTGWLGPMDVVDYAPDTINHGSATAILCNQKGISLKEPPIPHGEDGITVLRLNLLLDGPYSEERLSTISTWTQGITPLLISTYAKTQPSMAEYTLHWNAQPQNLSGGDLWCLRVANIGHCSDSARYRQLGNAVAVPVAQWIASRILALT